MSVKRTQCRSHDKKIFIKSCRWFFIPRMMLEREASERGNNWDNFDLRDIIEEGN